MYKLRRINKATLHHLGIILFIVMVSFPSYIYAGSLAYEPTIVNENETQLAKWFSEREETTAMFQYSLDIGYRKDDLSWSIATDTVSHVSEVSWKNTEISQATFSGEINIYKDWLVTGYYSVGAVASGGNQDSDYAASNRTNMYMHSESKTGGSVDDVSLAIGKKLVISGGELQRTITITPLLGFSIHEQSFTMYDGHQTVPFEAVLTNLNNTYDTQWRGIWFGAESMFEIDKKRLLKISYVYNNVDYSADANWNLRRDFSHPLSFKHEAKGKGQAISIGGYYIFSKNVLFNLSFDYQKWVTKRGVDKTYFSYGTTEEFTLNPVMWRSHTYSMGVTYNF